VFVEPYSPQYTEFRVCPCEYADQAPLIPSLCRSKDAVIHLWDLPQTAIVKTKNLKPYQAIDCSSAKHDADLTSLDWNCHGTLLSVGSYDATLRIYTVSAELYFESRLHKVRTPGWRVCLQDFDLPTPIRAQYLLRASPGTGDGSLLPAWIIRCVSGTSRRSRDVCSTSIEVNAFVWFMSIPNEGLFARNLLRPGLVRRRAVRQL
jgi:WD40 repeat protein